MKNFNLLQFKKFSVSVDNRKDSNKFHCIIDIGNNIIFRDINEEMLDVPINIGIKNVISKTMSRVVDRLSEGF